MNTEQPKSEIANLTSPVPTRDLPPAPFSAQQLRQYEAYERVRKGGRYNMFDPRARRATGLDADAYVFVMENFGALRDAADATEAEPVEGSSTPVQPTDKKEVRSSSSESSEAA